MGRTEFRMKWEESVALKSTVSWCWMSREEKLGTKKCCGEKRKTAVLGVPVGLI